MGLVDEQWAFLKDVALLIQHAEQHGYVLTAGEMFRPLEMQELYIKRGQSKTLASKHLERLAVDFNLFVSGQYVGSFPSKDQVTAYSPLGIFWKSLSPKNSWGGDWGWDANHFERTTA